MSRRGVLLRCAVAVAGLTAAAWVTGLEGTSAIRRSSRLVAASPRTRPAPLPARRGVPAPGVESSPASEGRTVPAAPVPAVPTFGSAPAAWPVVPADRNAKGPRIDRTRSAAVAGAVTAPRLMETGIEPLDQLTRDVRQTIDPATYRVCAVTPGTGESCSPDVPFGSPVAVDVTGDSIPDVEARLGPVVDVEFPLGFAVAYETRRIDLSDAPLPAHVYALFELPTGSRRGAVGFDGLDHGLGRRSEVRLTMKNLAEAVGGIYRARATVEHEESTAGSALTLGLWNLTYPADPLQEPTATDPILGRFAVSPVPASFVLDAVVNPRLNEYSVTASAGEATRLVASASATLDLERRGVELRAVVEDLPGRASLDFVPGSGSLVVAYAADSPIAGLRLEGRLIPDTSQPADDVELVAEATNVPESLTVTLDSAPRFAWEASGSAAKLDVSAVVRQGGQPLRQAAAQALGLPARLWLDAGAPPGGDPGLRVTYSASDRLTALDAQLDDRTLSAAGDATIADLPRQLELTLTAARAELRGSDPIGSIRAGFRYGDAPILTYDGDYATLNAPGSGFSTGLRLDGLRGALVQRGTGEVLARVERRTPTPRSFTVKAVVPDLDVEAVASTLPDLIEMTVKPSSVAYRASAPIDSLDVSAAFGQARADATATGIPVAMDLGWTFSPGATLTLAGSTGIVGLDALFVSGAGAAPAVSASLRGLPAFLKIGLEAGAASVDARSAADAAPGSASVGTLLAKFGSDGAFLTGTPGDDHLVVQETTATRAELQYSGLRLAEIDVHRDASNNPRLHLYLANAAPRTFVVAVATTKVTLIGTLDKVPATLAVDLAGSTLSYRASSTVPTADLTFDTKLGTRLGANVQNLPASLDLTAQLGRPVSTVQVLASSPVTRISLNAVAGSAAASLQISTVPRRLTLTVDEAPSITADADAPVGPIVGSLTLNGGPVVTLTGRDYLTARRTAAGAVGIGFGVTGLRSAEINPAAGVAALGLSPGGQAFTVDGKADSTRADGKLVERRALFEAAKVPATMRATLRPDGTGLDYVASAPIPSLTATYTEHVAGAQAVFVQQSLETLPDRVSVAISGGTAPSARFDGSAGIGRVTTTLRGVLGGAAADLVLTGLPPFAVAKAGSGQVSFDARTKADAPAGSALLGKLDLRFGSDGAYPGEIPGTDHAVLEQTGSAVRLRALVTGVQMASLRLPSGEAHALLRLASTRDVTLVGNTTAGFVRAMLVGVPQSLAVDVAGGAVTYAASAAVTKTVVEFDDRAALKATVEASNVPASARLAWSPGGVVSLESSAALGALSGFVRAGAPGASTYAGRDFVTVNVTPSGLAADFLFTGPRGFRLDAPARSVALQVATGTRAFTADVTAGGLLTKVVVSDLPKSLEASLSPNLDAFVASADEIVSLITVDSSFGTGRSFHGEVANVASRLEASWTVGAGGQAPGATLATSAPIGRVKTNVRFGSGAPALDLEVNGLPAWAQIGAETQASTGTGALTFDSRTGPEAPPGSSSVASVTLAFGSNGLLPSRNPTGDPAVNLADDSLVLVASKEYLGAGLSYSGLALASFSASGGEARGELRAAQARALSATVVVADLSVVGRVDKVPASWRFDQSGNQLTVRASAPVNAVTLKTSRAGATFGATLTSVPPTLDLTTDLTPSGPVIDLAMNAGLGSATISALTPATSTTPKVNVVLTASTIPSRVRAAFGATPPRIDYASDAGIGTILGTLRLNDGDATPLAGDHLAVRHVPGASLAQTKLGVSFSVGGLRTLRANPLAGEYVVGFSGGARVFTARASSGADDAELVVTKMPSTFSAFGLAPASSRAVFDAADLIDTISATYRRSGVRLVDLDLTTVPRQVALAYRLDDTPTVDYVASDSLGEIVATLRPPGLGALRAVLRGLPRVLTLALSDGQASLDARSAPGAQAGSASVGCAHVAFSSAGDLPARFSCDPDPTGKEDFVDGVDIDLKAPGGATAPVFAAEAKFSGYRLATLDARGQELHAALANDGGLQLLVEVDALLGATATHVDGSIVSVPSSMRLDAVGGHVTYSASADIGLLSLRFGPVSRPVVQVFAYGLPDAVDLAFDPAGRQLTWTASGPTTSLGLDADLGADGFAWKADLTLNLVPPSVRIGFDQGLRLEATSALGSIVGTLHNNDGVTPLPDSHVMVTYGGGALDVSLNLGGPRRAEFTATPTGIRAAVEGDPTLLGGPQLLADLLVGTIRAKLDAKIDVKATTAPSRLEIVGSGATLVATADKTFDVQYADVWFGFAEGVRVTPNPAPSAGRVGINDGSGCVLVPGRILCGSGIKLRAASLRLPVRLELDLTDPTREPLLEVSNFSPVGGSFGVDAQIDDIPPVDVILGLTHTGIQSSSNFGFGPFGIADHSDGSRELFAQLQASKTSSSLRANVTVNALSARAIVGAAPAGLRVSAQALSGGMRFSASHGSPTTEPSVTLLWAPKSGSDACADAAACLELTKLPATASLDVGRIRSASLGGDFTMPGMSYQASDSDLTITAQVQETFSTPTSGGQGRLKLQASGLGAQADIGFAGPALRFTSSPATKSVSVTVAARLFTQIILGRTCHPAPCDGMHARFDGHLRIGNFDDHARVDDFTVTATGVTDATLGLGPMFMVTGGLSSLELEWGRVHIPVSFRAKVEGCLTPLLCWPMFDGGSEGTFDLPTINFHPYAARRYTPTIGGFTPEINTGIVCGQQKTKRLGLTLSPEPFGVQTNRVVLKPANLGDLPAPWIVVPNPVIRDSSIPVAVLDAAVSLATPGGGPLVGVTCR